MCCVLSRSIVGSFSEAGYLFGDYSQSSEIAWEERREEKLSENPPPDLSFRKSPKKEIMLLGYYRVFLFLLTLSATRNPHHVLLMLVHRRVVC